MRSSRWAMMPAAISLVSQTARRQNSMPVQEIVWRRNEVASTGAAGGGHLGLGLLDGSSGTSSTSTFWRLVKRTRPVAEVLGHLGEGDASARP